MVENANQTKSSFKPYMNTALKVMLEIRQMIDDNKDAFPKLDSRIIIDDV